MAIHVTSALCKGTMKSTAKSDGRSESLARSMPRSSFRCRSKEGVFALALFQVCFPNAHLHSRRRVPSLPDAHPHYPSVSPQREEASSQGSFPFPLRHTLLPELASSNARGALNCSLLFACFPAVQSAVLFRAFPYPFGALINWAIFPPPIPWRMQIPAKTRCVPECS